MAKLQEFSSFCEKKACFGEYCVVNKSEELSKELDRLVKNSKNLLFRGVNEAKYQLFTSGQREYIQNDYKTIGIDYQQFVEGILKNLNDDALAKYNEAAHIEVNAAWKFAYLQHYGAPTTFLDFTESVYIALFFASHNVKLNPSNLYLDNYISLYYTEIDELPDLKEKCLGKIKKITGDENENCKDREGNRVKLIKNVLGIGALTEYALFRFSTKKKVLNFDSYSFICNIANRNMIAQEGVLIYNSDELKTLDGCIKIGCVDIHKSLLPFIEREWIDTNEFNYESLFPDEYRIAQNAYMSFKKEI